MQDLRADHFYGFKTTVPNLKTSCSNKNNKYPNLHRNTTVSLHLKCKVPALPRKLSTNEKAIY